MATSAPAGGWVGSLADGGRFQTPVPPVPPHEARELLRGHTSVSIAEWEERLPRLLRSPVIGFLRLACCMTPEMNPSFWCRSPTC